MPEGLAPAEIDAYVAEAMRRGEDLYHLDAGALSGLDADLVVTQDLCAVCAVDVSVVDDALAHLGCTAEVLTIDPHTLDEVLASIDDARHGDRSRGRGGGAGRRPAGAAGGGARPGRRAAPAAGDVPGVDRPAVRARPLGPRDDRGRRRRAPAGTAGEKSERVTWEAVACGRPGRLRRGAVRLRPRRLPRRSRTSWSPAGRLPAGVPVHAVDANASWARPGTRLVDGVEELAALLHPPTG